MINFLIVGVQKGGTTMIKNNLIKLDNIYIPNEELHFFDKNYDKGISWYEEKFIKYNENKNIILGEKTPNYILSNLYLDRIKNYNPNIKIILCLRNPITRALSHWNHFNQISMKDWIIDKSFSKSIEYNPDILANGNYYEQILYLYKIFPKESIYICINENFEENIEIEFDKLCNFLNVENKIVDYENSHIRKYTNNIYIDDIKFLINYYKKEINKINKLLENKTDVWYQYIELFNFNKQFEYIDNSSKHLSKQNSITAIITCVNYSDFLKKTIHYNKRLLKNIIVITDYNDIDTHLICKNTNIKYIMTNKFYEKETFNFFSIFNIFNLFSLSWWNKLKEHYLYSKKPFNKSKAINHVISNYTDTDWILLLDADIILSDKIVNVNVSKLSKDTLYGTRRLVYTSKNDWINRTNGYIDNWKFVGFFQLFNKKDNNFIKDYYGYDEQFNYANLSDYFFMKKWKKKYELNFPVIHLGETEKNWKGRITESWD